MVYLFCGEGSITTFNNILSMFTTLEQNCNQSSRIVNVMLGCTSTLLIYGLLRMKGRSMFSISSKPFSGTDVNLCPKTPRKIDDNDCMLTPCEKRITGVQSVSDIEEKILIAARATAQAYARPASEHALIARLYQKCQDKTDRVELLDALKKAILQRPDLANIRAANMGRYMCDGGTLLHTASRSGNLGAIEFLLQQGSLSPWDIDLQGRLPLHWAAENWHVDACRMLLEAMRTSEKYTHCDFRGVDAPTDLMGLTPLGWACVGSSRRAGQPKPPQELIDLLFAPGDGSIMPPTPYEMRSGSRCSKCHHTVIYLLLIVALVGVDESSVPLALKAQGRAVQCRVHKQLFPGLRSQAVATSMEVPMHTVVRKVGETPWRT